MADISFDTLFDDDPYASLGCFAVWVNDFLRGLEAPTTAFDFDKAFSFVASLRKDNFPANGGYEKASPFKKAASIYVWLHAENPFTMGLPESLVGSDLAAFQHSTASVAGYILVKECLRDVQLNCADGTIRRLSKPIEVSRHFLHDLVEASRDITPSSHFKTYSLLFESLAYQTNKKASYERLF